jgi:hypothetical protein
MPTLKELMGDKTRGDGRKFTKPSWDSNEWFEPIFLTKTSDKKEDWIWQGMMHTGIHESLYADWASDWHEWTPPKQTKKVKLYSPVIKTSDNTYVMASMFGCEEHRKTYSDKNVVGWNEIQVEVDE